VTERRPIDFHGEALAELLEDQQMIRLFKYKRRFKSQRRAPLVGRLLRRRLGIEQLCDECSKPYLDRPDALPVEHRVHGSAVALIFEEYRFGKRQFYVQLGRNAAYGQRLLVSTLFPEDHLKDAAIVAKMAKHYIDKQKAPRLVSRRKKSVTG
jgi:hypothetical protein